MSEAASIARALQSSSDEEDDDLILAKLRGSPNIEAVLDELAHHPDLEIRGWGTKGRRAPSWAAMPSP